MAGNVYGITSRIILRVTFNIGNASKKSSREAHSSYINLYF